MLIQAPKQPANSQTNMVADTRSMDAGGGWLPRVES
jgi:hypothetical protein